MTQVQTDGDKRQGARAIKLELNEAQAEMLLSLCEMYQEEHALYPDLAPEVGLAGEIEAIVRAADALR